MRIYSGVKNNEACVSSVTLFDMSLKSRRKRYFVKEGDHWGLLGGALVLILVLVLLASGLFYLLANRDLQEATYRAHFQALRNTMQMLLPWLVVVNLVGLVVVLVLAVFFTHRISGPAYHLISDLRRLKNGDLTVGTSFRKHDRLKNLARAMTEATAHLRQTVDEVKRRLHELSELADKYPELKEKLEEIKNSLDKLKT